MLAFTMLMSLKVFSVPKLNSYPSAAATIFLDFDGHYVSGTLWNNGNPISCAPSGMTDAQITEAFNRVAEDYRPFNVNITTDSTVFLAAPIAQRIRMIITPSSAWCPGVGGVAIIGSFTWGDDTPAFVYWNELTSHGTDGVGAMVRLGLRQRGSRRRARAVGQGGPGPVLRVYLSPRHLPGRAVGRL